MIYDAMIIGGGASGLIAACALSKAGKRIVLLEKQNRVGRKLLSTGNGRCNFTNMNATPGDYHGSRRAARMALKAWPPEKIVAFFDGIGIPSVIDEAGRVYPMSGQAASLLDALRLFADEHGVETRTEFAVSTLTAGRQDFTAVSSSGEKVRAKTALIATGGLAAPKLGACGDGYRLLEAFGHGMIPRFPVIAALKTPPETVRGLKGIRAAAEIALIADDEILRTERGEILFAESGVSGIAAMQLAREVGVAQRAGRKCFVRLNFLNPKTDAFQYIEDRARRLPERSLEDFLNGVVQKRLGQMLIKAAGVEGFSRKAGALSRKEIAAIAGTISGWKLSVTGTQGFEQAQATAGGVDLKDFDMRTMESRKQPGLFAAGEVLDVDGDCGGFNLQWAWASGLMAAQAIETL